MTTLDQAALVTTGLGMGATIEGFLNIGDGDLVPGARKIVGGLTLTNFGARYLGFNNTMPQDLLKYSLCEGVALIALKGISHITDGLSDRNFFQIVKGAAQSAIGITGFFYLESLGSKVYLVAHQTLLLTLASTCIAKSGLSDFAKEKYKVGIGKLLLGMGGLAGAGYYAYKEFFDQEFDDLDRSVLDASIFAQNMQNQSNFHQTAPVAEDLDNLDLLAPDASVREQNIVLSTHKDEIKHILANYEEPPGSSIEKLGRGASKQVYWYPKELPGSIIKISDSIMRWGDGRNDAESHYLNLQEAKKVVQNFQFKHIKIPDCRLVNSPFGPFVVEEKFDLMSFRQVPDGPAKSEANREFKIFKMELGLCDTSLDKNHNVGVLKKKDPLQNQALKDPVIGPYDFDCRTHWIAQWLISDLFIPIDHLYQIGAEKVLTAGAISALAFGNAIREIGGNQVVQRVIAAGAAGTVALAILFENAYCDPLESYKPAPWMVDGVLNIVLTVGGGSIVGNMLVEAVRFSRDIISKTYSHLVKY